MPTEIDFASMLGPGGGIKSPGPLTTGNVKPFDWNLLSMMLGRGAQAFSAEEPQAWQGQLGGVAAGFGESKKFAEAATKARAGQKNQTQMLIDLLGGKPTPQGIPGLTKYEVGPKGEIKMSLTPDREGYTKLFGMEPLALGGANESMYPVTEPSPSLGVGETTQAGTTPQLGGAGGRSAMHPFFKDLPTP